MAQTHVHMAARSSCLLQLENGNHQEVAAEGTAQPSVEGGMGQASSLQGPPRQRGFLSWGLPTPQIVLSGTHLFSGPLGRAQLLINQETETKPHAARV